MCTEQEKEEDLKKIPTDDNLSAFMAVDARHSHIYEMIRMLWGSYVCDFYLDKLFSDTRNGSRRGFEPNMLEALTKISRLHASGAVHRDKVAKFRSVV